MISAHTSPEPPATEGIEAPQIAAGGPMDRSLAFTCLLEWPEFGKLPTELGTRIVTELVRVHRENGARDMWRAYLAYRAIVGEGNLEPHAHTLAAS